MSTPVFDRKIIAPEHYLYTAILRECEGHTKAVYWPEHHADGWLCTCGEENPASATFCRGCGIEESWLSVHFDRKYLSEQQLLQDKEASFQRQKEREKTKNRQSRARNLRRLLIVCAGILLITALVLLSVLVIVPRVQWARAESLEASGDYLAAAELYDSLGYPVEAARVLQLHDNRLAGKENAYSVLSSDYPAFSITEDGSLRVNAEELKKSGLPFDPFRVPDVVDHVLVTSIADLGFLNCDFLLSVLLPEGITRLGERAFCNCSSMTEITLPDSLTSLGERCFINCLSLQQLSLPDSVRILPARLCNNCTSLASVEIKGSLTEIRDYAFSGCTSLSALYLPLSLTRIGDYAFYQCTSLTGVIYAGTSDDFSRITLGAENDCLTAALRFFDTASRNS